MADNYVLDDQTTFENGDREGFPCFVYKHRVSDFRVVVCQVPGPVCKMTVCVPTLCKDHNGKPHTLEHLVFCGSKAFPYRGYIDTVASHNLGVPMNATTFNDMTLFKFTGLSQQGAANVLPVALDHIMHPLLLSTHFATEVYHVDIDGKPQGVVFSEMCDFAFKESAVRSLNLRQNMYPPRSTYSFEAGGLPQSITELSNGEVKEYHSKYYGYGDITLLLVGAYDERPAEIFSVLDKLDAEIAAAPPKTSQPMKSPQITREKRRHDVVFASEKATKGSMAFAWEGPAREDVESQIALEMLIDYLKNEPTSPMRQRFTNRLVQIAGDIDFCIRPYIPTMIELNFLEVPLKSYATHLGAAVASTTMSTQNRRPPTYVPMSQTANAVNSYPSPAEAYGATDLSTQRDDVVNLFSHNSYRRKLMDVFTYMTDYWLRHKWSHFHGYITKRNVAIAATFNKAAMDDSNTHGLIQMLSRDATAFRFSPASISNGKPTFGMRARQFTIRRELEQKDHTFWEALIQRWLIGNKLVHLAMIPDSQMGIQIEAERNLAKRSFLESLTPKKMKEVEKKNAEAIESTKISIPAEILMAIPPTPDISKVQLPPFYGFSFNLASERASHATPFGTGRVLIVPSEIESKLQVSLPLAGLSSELHPYLPLFTELLTSSTGLILPHALASELASRGDGQELHQPEMPMQYVPAEQVDASFSRILTQYNSFIGSHSESENSGLWPYEILTLYGSTESENLHTAFKWLLVKLLFGDFGVDAIHKTAAKLSTVLDRRKGLHGSLLIDTFQWLRAPGALDASSLATNPLVPGVITRNSKESLGRVLNLYFQASFMKSVTQSLSNAVSGDDSAPSSTHTASDAIARIRMHFVNCAMRAGLLHVSMPEKQTDIQARAVVDALLDEWQVCTNLWRNIHLTIVAPSSPTEPVVHYAPPIPLVTTVPSQTPSPPRKRHKSSAPFTKTVPERKNSVIAGSPSERRGSCAFVDLKKPLGLHLQMSELRTSYFGVQVPLAAPRDPKDTSLATIDKQLETLPALDIFSLQILTGLLSRSEGPLKNAIRGRGHAYGIGIHNRADNGHLAIYISHAVDCIKALHALWEVIEEMCTEDGWAARINEIELSLSKSMFMFRMYQGLVNAIPFDDATAILRGFSGLEESIKWSTRHIEHVSVDDLRRVFLKYFQPIVQKNGKRLYLFTTPNMTKDEETAFMKQLNDNPYEIEFKQIQPSVLDPIVNI